MILRLNNVTTPEQNEQLLKFGLTHELADEKFNEHFTVTVNDYAFSLTRLIDLLPDFIDFGDTRYYLHIDKTCIQYNYNRAPLFTINKHNDIGYINNAYIVMIIEAIEYLYNNNLYKFNF